MLMLMEAKLLSLPAVAKEQFWWQWRWPKAIEVLVTVMEGGGIDRLRMVDCSSGGRWQEDGGW